MALVKTVEMRILANAGDAQAQLDAIAAKADKLDGDSIRMRFRLDDAEGKAQLDAIAAKADRLGFKDISIKVRVDGAGKAIADLLAVKKAADSAGGPNKIQSLIGKLFGVGGGGAGGAGGGGGLFESLGGASPLMVGGIAAAVPAVEALLVELTGLVSGFTAAGAGAGAFALLAVPAVKKVEAAYSGLSTAQQAYAAAQAKEAEAPTKANQKALAAAALNLDLARDAIGKLPASEQKAVSGIQQLVTTFGKVSTAFQPQAFKVFAAGLKLVGDLLPHVTPFASTFATVISGLLGQLDRAISPVQKLGDGLHHIQRDMQVTGGAGFGDFLAKLHSIEGPALTAIGEGFGKVAVAFGKLITTMSGKDVAQTIGIAFNTIAGIISGVASAVAHLMTAWDGMSATARRDAHEVASSFDAIRSGAESAAKGAALAFADVEKAAESAASLVVSSWGHAISFIASIPGKIKGVFADAGSWLLAAGRAIVEGLVKGIESMVGAAVGAAEHVGSSIVGSITSFLGIHSPSRVMHNIGQLTIQGLITGMQSLLPLLEKVSGGAGDVITKKVGSALLKALAGQKAVLQAEITQSQQIASSEIGNASVMSAGSYAGALAGGTQPASQTLGGLAQMAADMRQFSAVIAQLRKMGLNTISLSQIIGAGSSQGLAVALGLAQGGAGSVAQVNQLEKQIRASATGIANTGGPVAYQAQQQIAQAVGTALKGQLASVNTTMAELSAALKGGAKGTAVDVTVRLVPGNNQAFALEVVKILKEYKRHGGNVPLGIA